MSEPINQNSKLDQVIWTPGSLFVEDFVASGKTSIHGTPVDEYLKAHPGSVLITFDEFQAQAEEIENRDFLKPWEEIEERQWFEKLEILPPEKWQKCGNNTEAFRMMEYYTGHITGHYIRIGQRYFTALRRNTQTYQDMTQEIKNQFSF